MVYSLFIRTHTFSNQNAIIIVTRQKIVWYRLRRLMEGYVIKQYAFVTIWILILCSLVTLK